MNIGERIVSLREKKGWNQRELARRAGINASVMNRIETGKRPLTDKEVTIFAELFDVTSDYLLGLSEKPTPSIEQKLKEIPMKKDEALHFFNIDGLDEDDVEFIKNQIEHFRKKAKQKNDTD
jgi:transcriptional regulator with XRE-family HTH domain